MPMTDYNPVGAGAATVGGEGGTPLLVTNRNNSGTGSLRWALERDDPRVVTFAPGVSGEIELSSEIRTGANLTLDGRQPIGDKVWVAGGRLRVTEGQCIIRGMLLRPGRKPTGDKPENRDCISVGIGTDVIRDVVIYGNDCRWSQDEAFTSWGNNGRMTFMLNMIGEALYQSGHEKDFQNGPDTGHSKGLLNGNKPGEIGSSGVTWAYNIAYCNRFRNALIKDDSKEVEFINNLVYGWGPQATEVGGNATARVQGNVYIPFGPNNPNGYRSAANAIGFKSMSSSSGVYLEDNITRNGSPAPMSTAGSRIRPSNQLFPLTFTPMPASQVYDYVFANAGAYPPGRGAGTQQRDDIIDRSLYEIQEGLGSFYNAEFQAKGATTTDIRDGSNIDNGTGGNDYVYNFPARPTIVGGGTVPTPDPTETITTRTLALGASPVTVPAVGGQLNKVRVRFRNAAGFSNFSNQIEATAVSASAIAAAVAASSNTAGYWDTSDLASMFQTSSKTGAVSNGSVVGAVVPSVGTVDLLQSTAADRPTWVSADNSLRSALEAHMEITAGTFSSNMMLSCIVDNSTDTDWFCLSDQSNSYAGWASGNNTLTPDGGLGTCTYLVDGVDVSSNRKSLRDALNDGNKHVLQIHGLNLASSVSLQFFRRTTTGFAGDIAHIVLCDTPNAAGITAIRTELEGK